MGQGADLALSSDNVTMSPAPWNPAPGGKSPNDAGQPADSHPVLRPATIPGVANRWVDRALLSDPSHCPGCAQPITGPRCGYCGLDAGGAAGIRLWAASEKVLSELEVRDELLQRMYASSQPANAPGSPGMSGAQDVPQARPLDAPGEFATAPSVQFERPPVPWPGMPSDMGAPQGPPQGVPMQPPPPTPRPEPGSLPAPAAPFSHQPATSAPLSPMSAALPPVNGAPPPPPPASNAAFTPPTAPAQQPTFAQPGDGHPGFAFTPSFAAPRSHTQAHPGQPGHPGAPKPRKAASWSIQNLLLILGAVLLAGASLVFLVFSWGEIDLGLRAIIIGGLTAVVFAAARFVQRRGLLASAEAISGIGALMVCLDAWALHATGVFTWGSTSDYLAGAAVVVGLILIGVGSGLKLLTPRAFGTALIPLGALALAGGRDSSLEVSLILTLGASCGLIAFHPRVDRLTARGVSISACVLFPFAMFVSLDTLLGSAGEGAPAFAAWALLGLVFARLTSGSVARFLTVACALGMTAAGLLAGSALHRAIGTGISDSVGSPLTGDLRAVSSSALLIAGGGLGVLVVVAISRIRSGGPRSERFSRVAVRTAIQFVGFFAAANALILSFSLVLAAAGGVSSTLWSTTGDGKPSNFWRSEGASLLDLILGLVVFAILMAALLRMRVEVRLTRVLLACSSLILLLALPALIPSATAGIGVWALLGLGLAAAARRRPASGLWGLAVRTGAFASVTAAGIAAFALGYGAGDPAIPADLGVYLLAGTLLVLSAVFVIARGWKSAYHRTAPFNEMSDIDVEDADQDESGMVAGSYVPSSSTVPVPPGALPAPVATAIPTATLASPSVRTALGLGAFASSGLATGFAALAAFDTFLAGPFVSALFLVAATLIAVIRYARTDRRTAVDAAPSTSEIEQSRATGLAAYVLLAAGWAALPLGFLVFSASPNWPVALRVCALALAFAALAQATILAFVLRDIPAPALRPTSGAAPRPRGFYGVPHTPSSAAEGAPQHSWGVRALPLLGALALPLAAIAVVGGIETFDHARAGAWVFVKLGVVAVLPMVAAIARPQFARVRRGCEGASIAVAFLLLLSLLDEVQHVGLGLMILAVGAFALATRHERRGQVWTGFALTIAGSWALAISDGITIFEVYWVPLALLFCALGVTRVRANRSHGLLLAALVALTLPTAVQSTTGPLWRASAILGAICALAVLARAVAQGRLFAGLHRTPTATPHGSTWPPADQTAWALVQGVGFLTLALTLIGPGGRAIVLAGAAERTGADPILTAQAFIWLAIALAVAIIGLITVDLARDWPRGTNPRYWGPSLLAALASIVILLVQGAVPLGEPQSGILAFVVVGIWGGVALLGTPPGWPPVHSYGQLVQRTTAPLLAAVFAAGIGAASTTAPWDLLFAWAGLFIAIVTIVATRMSGTRSSWTTATYGVLATVGPLTLVMIANPTGWRVALSVLFALAWLLVGLRMQWQAPVTLGMIALAVQVGFLAGPPALATAAGLQGWVVLASAGAVLLVAGLAYERQVKRAKTIVRRFRDLR